MASLGAYLVFNGNCREAMTFYQKCLGGELNLNTVGESPAAPQMTGQPKDKILHAELTNGKIKLMASDMFRGEEYRHGSDFSLCLVCDNREELKSLFSNLSAGGQVRDPVREEFFGTFGAVVDKFGFNWMFQADVPKY